MEQGILCPYCRGRFTRGPDWTLDHVFVKALGGHAKVPACRSCNSKIGSEIEGDLQRPEALLNLIKQIGGSGNPLRGVVGDSERRVDHDLASNEVRSAKPVTKTQSGNIVEFKVEGSPAQVRDILKKQGRSNTEIENLIASATQSI